MHMFIFGLCPVGNTVEKVNMRSTTSQIKLKQFYNNVLSQTLSDCGQYLFAGNRNGDIFVLRINDIEKATGQDTSTHIDIYSQGPNVEINSLCFYNDFLIVGTMGVIYGLKWDDEKKVLSSQKKWSVNIQRPAIGIDVPEVNKMFLISSSDILYAACGDNIYQINLDNGRIMREYNGHNEYIHDLTGKEDGRLYSASEDGTVRLWCDRQKEHITLIEPGKNIDLMRPEFGKWIGSVDTNNNWLICGGGPKLSIWHLNTLECMHEFEFGGKIHVSNFVGDNIFVGGEHNHVQFYSINGDLLSNIPVQNTATYSFVWQMCPFQFMSVGGYSNKLHILKDFRFLDTKIDLYKERIK